MPAKRPEYLPDHYYHFYNRGAHRISVFREDENYLFALRKVKTYGRSLALTPIAYCLMPNHYHFLIRQDGEQPAGLLPQRVFNSYSKAYNKRYEHSGTLFEGNYKVALVEDEAHLLHLCRYIHTNPVKHGLVADVAEWPYSNYLEWIGERSGTLVDRDFVQDHFRSPQNYREFVLDYLVKRQLPKGLEAYLNTWEQ
jgi:putative transposase